MPSPVESLGMIADVHFGLAVSEEPWALPLDHLVVSVSPSGGLGNLAQEVDDHFPELRLEDRDLSSVTPDSPQVLELAGRRRPRIVLTNVRPDRSGGSAVPPADLGTVARAVRSSLGAAGGRVGLPLLGSGGAGLPLDLVAVEVVRTAVKSPGPAGEIVFLCVDKGASAAVLDAWREVVPPQRTDQLPVEPTRRTEADDAEVLAALSAFDAAADPTPAAAGPEVGIVPTVLALAVARSGGPPDERVLVAALASGDPVGAGFLAAVEDPGGRLHRMVSAAEVGGGGSGRVPGRRCRPRSCGRSSTRRRRWR